MSKFMQNVKTLTGGACLVAREHNQGDTEAIGPLGKRIHLLRTDVNAGNQNAAGLDLFQHIWKRPTTDGPTRTNRIGSPLNHFDCDLGRIRRDAYVQEVKLREVEKL